MKGMDKMIKKIDDIMEDGSLSAKEKINAINEWRQASIEEIQNIAAKNLSAIKSTFRYCKHCQDWYRTTAFSFHYKIKTVPVCINTLTGGYLDDYKYEDKKARMKVKICPKGHEEEELDCYVD